MIAKDTSHGGNVTIQDTICQSHSLPWYTMLKLGVESCDDITKGDVDKMRSLLEMCYPLYRDGFLKNDQRPTSSEQFYSNSDWNMNDCYTDRMVYLMFEYLLPKNAMKETKSGEWKLGKIKYTLLVSHDGFKLEFKDYFEKYIDSKSLQTGSVEIVGMLFQHIIN